jgi:hypothetical protein
MQILSRKIVVDRPTNRSGANSLPRLAGAAARMLKGCSKVTVTARCALNQPHYADASRVDPRPVWLKSPAPRNVERS